MKFDSNGILIKRLRVVGVRNFVKIIEKQPRIKKKDYYPYIKYVLTSIKSYGDFERTHTCFGEERDVPIIIDIENFSKTQKRQLKGTRKTSTLKELKEAVIKKYNIISTEQQVSVYLHSRYNQFFNAENQEEIFISYKDWELNILGEDRFKYQTYDEQVSSTEDEATDRRQNGSDEWGRIGFGKKYLIIKKGRQFYPWLYA